MDKTGNYQQSNGVHRAGSDFCQPKNTRTFDDTQINSTLLTFITIIIGY